MLNFSCCISCARLWFAYCNYNRGFVKIKNGSTWDVVAQWNFQLSKLIFTNANTDYEVKWSELMRWLYFYTTSYIHFYSIIGRLYNWHCGHPLAKIWVSYKLYSQAKGLPMPLKIMATILVTILLIQETRFTSYGQSRLHQLLDVTGWGALWSQPRPSQRDDSNNVSADRMPFYTENRFNFKQLPPFYCKHTPLCKHIGLSMAFFLQNLVLLYTSCQSMALLEPMSAKKPHKITTNFSKQFLITPHALGMLLFI